MSELDNALIINRAQYERWLGTEPDEIAAAADDLRSLHPDHPSLPHLASRLRQAHAIKRMLREILEPAEWL